MHWQKIVFLMSLYAAIINPAVFDPDLLKDMTANKEKSDGFELLNSLNLTFSFDHSRSRLGIKSGNYVDIAGKASSALRYQKSIHQANTALFWAEGLSLTPSSDGAWGKSIDTLRWEARYMYNTLPWLSLFTHARVETSVFESVSRHNREKNFELQNADGEIKESKKIKMLKLSDPFAPIFVQENLGLVSRLLEKAYLNIEAKTALSLRQTWADGQIVLVKEEEDLIVVRDLKNFYSLGFLLGASFNGQTFSEGITYRAGLDATWPLWQRPKADRSFIDSLIIEASFDLGLKLSSFISLHYEYTAQRLPEILDELQQNHLINLILSFEHLYAFGG